MIENGYSAKSKMEFSAELSYVNRDLTYAKERHFHFDQAGEVNVRQDISYVGGTVWDASVVLAHYLNELGREKLENKRTIELGAGTALPSIVAARLGAAVIVTDLVGALPATNDSLKLNLAPNSPVEVQALKWGDEIEDCFIGSLDYILGADLVYDEIHFDALENTLKKLAGFECQCKHAPKIILSFEQRRKALDKFFQRFTEDNFMVQSLSSPMLEDARAEAKVHVYMLQRSCKICSDS